MAVTSPCSERILPETASTGQRRPVSGSTRPMLAAAPLALCREEEVGDEGGEVGVVGLHAHGCLGRAAPGRSGEQPLGRRVHHDQRARGVGHQDGVGHGVDDEVQPVALRAHLRLRDAQLAVVLLDLLGGPAQVGDVAQDGDDARPLAGVAGHGGQELEEEVRPVDGVDQQQLAAAGRRSWIALWARADENSMLLRATARRRPSLSPSRAAKRRSARRVGDEHAALGVGEQDRVGHRVRSPGGGPARAGAVARPPGWRPAAEVGPAGGRGRSATQSSRPGERWRRRTRSRPPGMSSRLGHGRVTGARPGTRLAAQRRIGHHAPG